MFTKHKPRIVGSGIDRIAVDIELAKPMTLATWEALVHDGPHDIDGAKFVFTSNRKERPALHRGFDFVIHLSHRSGLTGNGVFRLSAGARTNALFGSAKLLRTIQLAVTQLFGPGATCRISYIELYVDLQGTSRPDQSLKNRVACRARRTMDHCQHDVPNCEGEPIQTMRWGKQERANDNVVGVYYEKPKLEPSDWRVHRWKQSGLYKPDETVRRLEFRVWGASRFVKSKLNPELEEMAAGGLNGMWKYLTEGWFRLLERPKTASGKKLKSHRWWKLIQAELPLATKPVLDRDFFQISALDLEPQVKRAAGHLRTIAGLSDSEADRDLAQLALLDAARALIEMRELRDLRSQFDFDDPFDGIDYEQ